MQKFKDKVEKRIKIYKELLATTQIIDIEHIAKTQEEFNIYVDLLKEHGLIVSGGKYITKE